MKLTAGNVDLMRTRPHRTKLWLSIYHPPTIFAAQVNNASIARGDMTIAFDGIITGAFGNIQGGETMYVGTTPGAWDVGRIRVRSSSATGIAVAENSDINWQDDLYITVVKYWEIWAKYPRLVQDGENVTFYKDWDYAYTDQNTKLGSFVCMGPHHAAFIIPEWGYGNVYYTAAGTASLDGEGMTYAWQFDGGDPTGSTDITPGFVKYTVPGHYTTRLTVTTADGVEDVSFRHISIWDYQGRGDDLAIQNWGFNAMEGNRDEGGYTCRVWVREPVDYLVDGMLCIVRADDWYGTTWQSLGGNATQRPGIVMVGYIVDGSIEYDYKSGVVEFTLKSPTGIMQQSECFSCSVENKSSPTSWTELKDMNVKRALYHYLRWHTTVMKCCDVQFVGGDHMIQYFDAERTSIYDAVQMLMNGTLLGDVVSDRQGKLWCEVDASATNNATGTFTDAFDIAKQDWMGTPSIDQRSVNDASYLEFGGIAYSGTSNGLPLMAAAPGVTPAYRGTVERRQGLALGDQNDLNQLVGNVFAFRNSRYPDITLQMAGNYRNFDIAPQEIVNFTMEANDTPLRVTMNRKPFTIRAMEWTYEGERQLFYPTIHMAEVTQGLAGQTLVIPEEPPDDGFGQPPVVPFPPIYIPPVGGSGATLDFIPVIYAESPVGTEIPVAEYARLTNAVQTSVVYGYFRVPATWTGQMTIKCVIAGGAAPTSGGINGEFGIEHGSFGESAFADFDGPAIYDVYFTSNNIQYEYSCTFTPSPGEFCVLYFKRYGGSYGGAGSEYANYVNFLGWIIS